MPRCIKGVGLFGITAWMGRPPRTISVVLVFEEVMFFLLSLCVILLNDTKIFHVKQKSRSSLLLVRFQVLPHLQWFFKRMPLPPQIMVHYGPTFWKAGYAVCAFLLKIWSLTWYLVVNSLATLTLKDMRCFRKNSDVDHKMICLYKCFNYTHPCTFAILYYFLNMLPRKQGHCKSIGYYCYKIGVLSCRS